MRERNLISGDKNQCENAVGLFRGTQWFYYLETGGKDRLRREVKSKGLEEKRTLVPTPCSLFPT